MNPESNMDYTQMMKAELLRLIDDLEIADLQKRFLKSRWLDQLLWMEAASKKNQRLYYIFRLACIIGGVMIPALVSLKVAGSMGGAVQFVTIVLSLIVAVSAAVEEFFQCGERWRHYRRTAEILKGEGWSYFQLTGHYQGRDTHAGAYPIFAGRVEEAFHREIEVYITKVSKQKNDDNHKAS